jgi:hypothetical protein
MRPLITLVLPCAAWLLPGTSPETPPRVAAEDIHRHVAFLGSDALEGRAAGSEGGERAARYVAGELERLGLRPLGDDGGFFQPVPLHASSPEPSNELFVVSECGSGPLRPGADYLLEAGGSGTLLPQPVDVVFAGFGIVAPEFDYSDYQGLDVSGKVVAVLNGEPPSDDPAYFEGERPTVYATAEAKQRLALSRGARGTLLLPSVQEPAWKDWDYWLRQYSGETVRLAYSVPRHLAARLSPAAAERLLCGSGLDLAAVHHLESRHGLRSFALPVQVRYQGSFHVRDFVSANVAAALPGSDPKLREEWVLVSAHYDHLGIGPAENGDTVYNGVVDNALGVAGALEIARALAAGPDRPRRSVAFLFTTAEERGLLGATHYVEHPLVPIARTVANVNVDGLAHLDAFDDVIGVGAELSDLGESLERVARRAGLRVSEPAAVLAGSEAFAYSDQAAFAEAGIPALLVNEGFEGGSVPADVALARFLEWGRTRYHRPSDDLTQPLDFEASRRHTVLLLDLVRELADADAPPRWRAGTRYATTQARARAEGR